jgi:integrase
MKGTQPFSPDTMRAKTLKPAAARAGIGKVIGWHSFRRTYATLLQSDGAAVKTTQDLLRHADAKTTMNSYAQSIPAERRAAQSKVASKIVPRRVNEVVNIVESGNGRSVPGKLDGV